MKLNFAVIDDSLRYQNNIYVYTHCLINQEDLQEHIFHIIGKNNNEIYNPENIKKFIQRTLYLDSELIGCNHYKQKYPGFNFSIDEHISRNTFKYFNKKEIKLFQKADQIAREESKKKLEELLLSINTNI